MKIKAKEALGLLLVAGALAFTFTNRGKYGKDTERKGQGRDAIEEIAEATIRAHCGDSLAVLKKYTVTDTLWAYPNRWNDEGYASLMTRIDSALNAAACATDELAEATALETAADARTQAQEYRALGRIQKGYRIEAEYRSGRKAHTCSLDADLLNGHGYNYEEGGESPSEEDYSKVPGLF